MKQQHAARQTPVQILRVEGERIQDRRDALAVEEPLEIRVAGMEPMITMRTPGHDLELTAGLLLGEGLVTQARDFVVLEHCMQRRDVVRVQLRNLDAARAHSLRRSGIANSACGVCGKQALGTDRLPAHAVAPMPGQIRGEDIVHLPLQLRSRQATFEQTGGLHAAALFDARQHLVRVREDIGRHNALDKLLGWALLHGRLPLHEHVVLLSGRASYELLQKCVMAQTPVVCAISAPSSYAVRLAQQFNITLIGFLREQRFNVYSAPERLAGPVH